MKKNQDIAYGIIGLGRFGSALARTLAEAGQEVIVLDKDEDKIKDMRQYTEYAFVTENLSQETLAETGIQNCDVVIVCIGEQVDVSILTTMRVIEMGIPHVISKALSAEQGAVLKKLGAEVVYPERDMALRLGQETAVQQFPGLCVPQQQRGDPPGAGSPAADRPQRGGDGDSAEIQAEHHRHRKWP